MTERPIGIGCMRVPPGDAGVATIVAALAAGATLLDTADVYGDEPHANERAVADAVRTSSARDRVTIVTKVGLLRGARGAAGARLTADGRASHLRMAIEESVAALGGPPDLLLLHAVDPRIPLETSMRALDAARRAGLAGAIGISNVTRTELERARAVAEIAAVEVAGSPFDDGALRGGVVAYCAAHGIRVLAHSPLGGPKRTKKLARDPTLTAVAARHGVTAAQVAIAWLRALSPVIVPIPGPRSEAAARMLVEGARLALDATDHGLLDARFAAGARLRAPRRPPTDAANGEVVLVMGIQGAGKSTYARALAAEGYVRLNRDELGGTLRGLVVRLAEALAGGARRVVLDNTYASRAARAEVLDVAWQHGLPVRCVLVDPPLELAQARVVRRIVEQHGRLLEPLELTAAGKRDPAMLPPSALYRFRRELEPPRDDEGFRELVIAPHTTVARPDFTRTATFVSLDALVRDGVLDTARLARLPPADVVVAFAWMPSDAERGRAALAAHGVELVWCTHGVGRPICWCRPPLPGLIVERIEHHRLDGGRATVVGTHSSHRPLADAVGARYVTAADLFT